jgi:hypothetical protein
MRYLVEFENSRCWYCDQATVPERPLKVFAIREGDALVRHILLHPICLEGVESELGPQFRVYQE